MLACPNCQAELCETKTGFQCNCCTFSYDVSEGYDF